MPKNGSGKAKGKIEKKRFLVSKAIIRVVLHPIEDNGQLGVEHTLPPIIIARCDWGGMEKLLQKAVDEIVKKEGHEEIRLNK